MKLTRLATQQGQNVGDKVLVVQCRMCWQCTGVLCVELFASRTYIVKFTLLLYFETFK